jgi:hypothetical protein
VKTLFYVVIILLLGATALLTACGFLESISQGDETAATFDSPFIFDDFEITLSSDVASWLLRTPYVDFDGTYAFSIPISVTNIGESEIGLNFSHVFAFSPDGWNTAIVPENVNEETNIFTESSILPNSTIGGYIYIVYSEDGEYIVEFTDRIEESIELRFDFQFNHESMRKFSEEFALGETIYFNGLEITFEEEILWGKVDRTTTQTAHLLGEVYFSVPVSLVNTTSENADFPYEFDVFRPDGTLVREIGVAHGRRGSISGLVGLLPDGIMNSFLHVLFDGDGEYRVVLRDRAFEFGEIVVVVPVHFND